MLSQGINKFLSFKWGQEVTVRVENVYKFFEVLKRLIIRIIVIIFTGFSIGIYKEAKKIANRLLMSYEMIMDTGTEDKSWKHIFYNWMFNLLMLEISVTNKIERLRIYKHKDNLFQFNPDKELINSLSKILYPKLNLWFPRYVEEKKISSFLVENSEIIKAISNKSFFKITNTDAHYGNYTKLSDKGVKYNFLTNWTSKSETFEQKNFIFDDKSYLVNPFIIESKNVKILNSYYIQDQVDNRLIGDEFNIPELWSLSWLGQNEYSYINKNLIPDKINKKISLKQLIINYGGEPNNSTIFDIDEEMRNLLIQYNMNLNPEKMFKLAFTENLYNNYDLLFYWANKLKNK